MASPSPSPSSSESYSIQHGEDGGQIEYTAEGIEVFIRYHRVEQTSHAINFWSGLYYQGSIDTETNRLHYSNDGITFSVKAPPELIEETRQKLNTD